MTKDLNFSDPSKIDINDFENLAKIFRRVVFSGNYILGENVSIFEKNFANYLNVRYAVGVASGTDALIIALISLGITFGDEVILPSFTATATASAVISVGAVPVFADIAPGSYNMDITKIDSLISKKTKAIIAVNLFGGSLDLVALKKITKLYKVFFIEDCAQSLGGMRNGVKLGTFGDISCFSFYPTKNLGALGDGGAIVTNSKQINDRLIKLRQYGWNKDRISVLPGRLSRLDEVQAAFLDHKLKSLDKLNQIRTRIAEEYDCVLNEFGIPRKDLSLDVSHANHLFVIETKNRSFTINFFKDMGIRLGIHYPYPVHLQDNFKKYSKLNVHLKETELVAKRVVSLPLYPGMKQKDVAKVKRGLIEIIKLGYLGKV